MPRLRLAGQPQGLSDSVQNIPFLDATDRRA